MIGLTGYLVGRNWGFRRSDQEHADALAHQ
jgi:hypothetical protein